LQLFEQLLKQLIHQYSIIKFLYIPDAVNVEVPSQLFTTFTTGAVGVLGAATPEPCKLVHPLALVVVTV
jgi:hypothetical protein